MWGLLATRLPYCGAPPAPQDLLTRWNLDPVLMIALVGAAGLYVAGTRSGGTPGAPRIATWRFMSFLAGWAVASLALISPLCALSVSLFSARVAQHMILALVAAPLVLLGRPGRALQTLWPRAAAQVAAHPLAQALRGAAAAAVLFAVFLWFWHAPAPYDATFASPLVYWLMHLTVFGSALLVWNVLLDAQATRPLPAMIVGAVSTLQMTFLGAIVTLTPRLLYAPHVITPYAWGLTQASDQQIGGLIMWVPGCGIFLAVTLVTLGRVMSERPHLSASA